jgi:hypothetical protein
MMNARPSFMMQAATSMVVDAFFSKPFVNSFFTGQALRGTVGVGTKWLFPEPKDIGGEVAIWNGEIMEHEWIDTGLNQEQRVSGCRFAETTIHISLSAAGCFFDRSTPITSAISYQRTSRNR